MTAFLVVGGALFLPWLFARLFLDVGNLSRFDAPTNQRFASDRPEHPGVHIAMERLRATDAAARGLGRKQALAVKRAQFDRMLDDHAIDAFLTPIDCDGVRGEWVLAPGADPARRMLYIHGGGMVVGSARSHRTITARMSALCGGAVLALDYRLMPEHKRMAGVEDCRLAWRWMLGHGPNGDAPADAAFVAGDSAGGNLALALLPWIRDAGLRQADAAVALSPLTDSSFASPSMRANLATDHMLGPMARQVLRVPRTALLWLGWLRSGIRPNHPVVSPLLGDLSNLPPVLIHASETEILFDDARRYVNRARAAGSPATLQSWNNTLHVWHIFYPELPEAGEAFAEIGSFLARTSAHEAPHHKVTA